MKITAADFSKLTVNEVIDLLINDMPENETESSAALLGVDSDGRKYNVYVTVEAEE